MTLYALDSEEFYQIAGGSGFKSNEVLGRVDTTKIRNGSYSLVLRAVDSGANVTSDSVRLDIEGNLKLGNFNVVFTDLTIPVSGIPITVTRRYDTLDTKTFGDFGYGWSLELSNTKTTVQMDPNRESDFSGYKPFRDGDRVIVTLPDGTREGFTFYGKPLQQGFIAPSSFTPTFIPDRGIKSQLIVSGGHFLKSGEDLLDPVSTRRYNPADPTFGGSYLLKLRNGNELLINAKTGDLDTITDRNGNTLKFTGQGIVSTAGRGVKFERDSWGRITALVDPNNKRIEYIYSAGPDGDLIAVKNRTGDITQFIYRVVGNGVPAHYLDEIIDPLGADQRDTAYLLTDRGGLVNFGGNAYSREVERWLG